MTSWHPNDELERQGDQVDQVVEVIIVILIALVCIFGLAYGPGILAGLGLK